MNLENIIKEIIKTAKKLGAEEADTTIVLSKIKNITIRNGETEIYSENISIKGKLRLFKNGKGSIIYFSDFNKNKIRNFIRNSLSYLDLSSFDSANTLPRKEECGEVSNPLDIYDDINNDVSSKKIIKNLIKMERSAFDYDSKIKYSEGSSYENIQNDIYFANSYGFFSMFKSSSNSYFISVVAEEKGEKQNGEFWSANVHLNSLESPDVIGVKAAQRAIRKMGAQKPKTGEYPVIFDNISASSILEEFAEMLTGEYIYKKSSLFYDRIGKKIASDKIFIEDNPLIKGLLNSRPFDGEGVLSKRTSIVEKGVLKSFLLNTYSANKIKSQNTANALISADSEQISPSNFFIKPSDIPEDELVNSVKKGIYITSIMSVDNINKTTGDFSWGVEGFMIEKGKITKPISEFTIAGNIINLFFNITELGDNLDFNKNIISSPSLMVLKGIIIGGK